MDIGSKLFESRRAAGLTQEQAAEALNVSRQTLSNWENNKTYPDLLKSMEISDFYGISLDVLLKDGSSPSEYAIKIASDHDQQEDRRKTTALWIMAFVLIMLLAVSQFLYLESRTHGYDLFSKYQNGVSIEGSDMTKSQQYNNGVRLSFLATGITTAVFGIASGRQSSSKKKLIIRLLVVIVGCFAAIVLLFSRLDPFSDAVVNYIDIPVLVLMILFITYIVSRLVYMSKRRKESGGL